MFRAEVRQQLHLKADQMMRYTTAAPKATKIHHNSSSGLVMDTQQKLIFVHLEDNVLIGKTD